MADVEQASVEPPSPHPLAKKRAPRKAAMKVGIEGREKDEPSHRVECDAVCFDAAVDRLLLRQLQMSSSDVEGTGSPGDGDDVQDDDHAAFDRRLLRLLAALEPSSADAANDALDTSLEGASAALGRRVTAADLARRARAALEARARLALLRRAPGVPQRTPEWYAAREGMVTASDAAQALGSGKFATQRSFFQKKCGRADEQAAFDGTLPPLKWGSMYEQVAQSAYSAQHLGLRVHEFGLLRHPGAGMEHVGASPDGVTDLGVMLEIKCPWRRRFVGGEVPMQYYYQIQAQLAVCGLSECDYFECEFYEPPEWDAAEWDAAPEGARGAFLELPPAGPGASSTYVYPPDALVSAPGAARADFERWMDAQQPQDKPQPPPIPDKPPIQHWWVLRRSACTRVTFDPEFAADMFERLGVVWTRVLAYRADRELYLSEVGASAVVPASSWGGGATRTCGDALQAYAFID
jgi:putative phage-type endonuclease